MVATKENLGSKNRANVLTIALVFLMCVVTYLVASHSSKTVNVISDYTIRAQGWYGRTYQMLRQNPQQGQRAKQYMSQQDEGLEDDTIPQQLREDFQEAGVPEEDDTKMGVEGQAGSLSAQKLQQEEQSNTVSYEGAIRRKFPKVEAIPADVFEGTLREKISKVEHAVSPWYYSSERTLQFIGSSRWYSRVLNKDKFILTSGWKTATGKHWGYECSHYRTQAECMDPRESSRRKAPSIIHPYQRFGRIALLRAVLWDKGSMCETMQAGIQERSEYFNYTFQCWNYPDDKQKLLRYAQTLPGDTNFIVKPVANSLGRGISVSSAATLRKDLGNKRRIVQTYMNDPFIINSRKWDVRLYVTLSSAYPLRAYQFQRGLARFAASKYKSGISEDTTMFLTNTHGTKQSELSQRTWAFSQIREYMNQIKPGLYEHVWLEITKGVSLVLLSAENRFVQLSQDEKTRRFGIPMGRVFHQMLGVDVIVASNGNAKVIEVNGRPNQSIQSPDFDDHYSRTKGMMIQDQSRLLYSKVDIRDKLAEYLEEISDTGYTDLLKPDEWVYLVKYMQERQNLGRFTMIYPNKDLDEFHTEFMKGLPFNTESRQALHKILMHIEKNYPPPPPDLDHDRLPPLQAEEQA
uniref:Tubulin--tyrosine ligase-like protein 5 n=1 Tax=Mucochytrium quahogii TaxID=96639 RepID=A0A7S2S0Y9_9STRA|mmetsp:Transcript_37603/g.61164  ORF Transcript_37603/g.61164 Transcript_37603/m.61164 type:complete len:632 (-) Transcript_37603:734-2629(-)|eukprot:CAMPEP_0203759130 /NCGR_PEP_ID=MMETSP0098-20131031/12061_1 /ASSEMBLY_ACC=CAM_ASM_000208 /TAXON_ID=96639 /ORGANISM=" , Strain NY0313808BC1" /LENGTH=631 /DNA_ID=CAMNT_0050651889 /DNA_START=125 /DNA_END=2020 /DNA_ORIENTATION=+